MHKKFAIVMFTAGLFLASAIHAPAATTPIDFASFDGSGFAPNPTSGQLDSDIWQVDGLSDDTTMDFGDTQTTGDFARGIDADDPDNGVSTGGVYAFDAGGGDMLLGIQPGGSDFTPGSITLKVVNESGSTVSDIYVAYEIWVLNDQGRANSLNFSYQLNCTDASGNFTPVSTLDYTTPETADDSPAWTQAATRSTTISGANLADGAAICLRWSGDDVSGSGARDEYGIDDIEVRIGSPTAITLEGLAARSDRAPLAAGLGLSLLAAGALLLRRRKTA